MSPSRRFASHGRASGARRQVGWSQGPLGITATLAAGTAQAIVPVGVTPGADGTTVVRIRGSWSFQVSVTPSILNAVFSSFGMGLCVVSSQAFAVGATAVPGPLSENGWDGWMWHYQGIAGVSQVGGGNAGTGVYQVLVDGKAMRKVPVGSVLIGVVEIESSGAAGNFRSELASRVLAKLA